MGLYGFAYTERALAYLKTVPKKIKNQVVRKIERLASDPVPAGSKKLKGRSTEDDEDVYRIRSGDHRVLYVVKENPSQVLILDIGDRKDIYK